MNIIKVIGPIALLALSTANVHGQDVGTIRLAEADSFSGEDLVQLIAYERARERGVNIELSSLRSDDIVFQAVLNGQLDMGIGDAYEAIANLDAPVRNIYQLRKLAYYPVVDKTLYADWAALDGQPFAVHSRGSGTETLAQMIEIEEGISFSEISYVPGSEVRVVAMQQGNVKATLLDPVSTDLLLESEPDRFGTLPLDDVDASDSTIYVNMNFLAENGMAVQILLEELLKSARATAQDPAWPAAQREELGLLPDLSAEEIEQITPYFEDAVAAGTFPTEGGGTAAAEDDVLFLSLAGTFDAALADDLEALWTFEPLEAALSAIGDE